MRRYCWRCTTPLEHLPPVVCDNCGQGHFNNPKPAADALVEHDRRVLLVRRAQDPWRDHWDIPGGFCEAGEHPIQTAERELLEETGVHARVIAFIGMWIDDYGSPQADGLQEMTLNVTYLTRPLDEQPIARSGSESAESRWFPLGTPPARLAFPKHVVPALEAAQRLLQMELPPVLDAASSSTW